MTWYTFFKSLHVVAAATWVGGAAIIQAYAVRITRASDARRVADFAKDTEIVSMRVFAWALSFLVGAGFLGAESGRIAKIIEAEGPESPAAQARISRILLISRCELVILIAVVVNMVVKPVGNAGWFWGLLAAMVAGVVAVVAAYSSSSMRSAPPATRSPSAM